MNWDLWREMSKRVMDMDHEEYQEHLAKTERDQVQGRGDAIGFEE